MKSFQFILPVVLLIAACGKPTPKEKMVSDDAPVPVVVSPLTQGTMSAVIPAAGKFTTEDETILSFKVGGVISSVLVKEGDRVRRGQTLATLRLDEINAQVEMAKLGLAKAERDFARAEALYKDSVATLEQFQNAQTALDFARQQANTATFNKDFAEIRAVADGYVLRKLAAEGQIVGPGTPILQTNGAVHGDWVLKVGLSDKDWARVQVGDSAQISTDAFPGLKLSAKVSSKSEGIDPFSGTFGADLKIAKGTAVKLAAGLFGRASIFPSQTQASMVVPYGALLDADADSGFIFLTADNKTASRKRVAILELGQDSVFVAGNIPVGASLIVSGSAYLRDGSPISLQPKK